MDGNQLGKVSRFIEGGYGSVEGSERCVSATKPFQEYSRFLCVSHGWRDGTDTEETQFPPLLVLRGGHNQVEGEARCTPI